jgi:hypothetical protein
MTIQKGAAWGTSAPAPHDMVVAESEEAAARAVQQGDKFVCLTSGNLLRALGSGIGDAQLPPKTGEPCLQLPCDIFEVSLNHDSTVITAVSSIVVGSRRRPLWWVTAGGFLGALNVAPRAHPNDGLADALEFVSAPSLRQLLTMRRRMRLGDHLPHPLLTMHRSQQVQWHRSPQQESNLVQGRFGGRRTASVSIDGKSYGRVHSVRVTVWPDAWTLCVPQRNVLPQRDAQT